MTATDGDFAFASASDDEEEEAAPRLRLVLADYFTLGNALCGFMAVWQLAVSQASQISTGIDGPMQRADVATAVVLLLVASTFDLFDGRVARRLGGSGMGAELDNLADVISFGFAPAFFVVTWGTLAEGPTGALPIIAAAAVLLAVVVRLARFSCQAPGSDYFTGLPGPFGAMAVITIVLLDPPLYVGCAGILAIAWLMVSRWEYPKPSGRLAFAMLAWILGSVACLTAWAINVPLGNILLYSGSSLVLVMILAIPIYVFATRHHGDGAEDDNAVLPSSAHGG